MEYDPRTGEPKKEMPLFARLLVLGIALAIAAYLFYDISASRDAGQFDTQRMAYNTVHDIRSMEDRFLRTHKRYGTLEELKEMGFFDYPIEDDEARCDYGIKVRLKLSMDRADYDLEVEYRRGIYRSSANDINAFDDFERDPAAGRRR